MLLANCYRPAPSSAPSVPVSLPLLPVRSGHPHSSQRSSPPPGSTGCFAFYHVAAYTGARRGELLNLHWSDIDLDGKNITVAGSTGIIDGKRVDGTTKSGRSRVVTIDDDTVSVLREHRESQAAEQLLAGSSRRVLARQRQRPRPHGRLGRTGLPRHRRLADDQDHPRLQLSGRGAASR
jgi:integrase